MMLNIYLTSAIQKHVTHIDTNDTVTNFENFIFHTCTKVKQLGGSDPHSSRGHYKQIDRECDHYPAPYDDALEETDLPNDPA